jgi:hypothetical protein
MPAAASTSVEAAVMDSITSRRESQQLRPPAPKKTAKKKGGPAVP